MPCFHNVIKYGDTFFEGAFEEKPVPNNYTKIPQYCIGYCIETKLCNTVFLAYNMTNDVETEFAWCKVYLTSTSCMNPVPSGSSITLPEILTQNMQIGLIPGKSELIFIGNTETSHLSQIYLT